MEVSVMLTIFSCKVRADFVTAHKEDPHLPVLIWMSDALVWQGAGFKSKTEILNRLWKATREGVFCTLEDLKKKNEEGQDRLVDLCLCAIKFLESELYVGK